MLSSCISFTLSGVVFGLSGGLSPGPLMLLVISKTMNRGVKEGIKVSIAPLITDPPIILFSVFLLSRLSSMNTIMGVLSLAGSAFLFYLGFESLRFRGTVADKRMKNDDSLKKGIVVNLLNPNPYLFWFTVGAPLILQSWNTGAVSAALFLLSFYLCLVGSKILAAVIIGKSKSFIKSSSYIYINRVLGGILVVYALLFIKKGIGFFGLW